MSYLLPTKRKRISWKKIVVVIVVFFVVSFLMARFLFAGLFRISNSVGGLVYSLLPQGFRDANSLARDNDALQAQILSLVAENADRNLLAQENEELRHSLGRAESKKKLSATILQKPSMSPYDTFILDIGSAQGVEVGNVVSFGNIAIGKIIEANTNYSKAELFSSSGEVFDAFLGKKEIPIQVKGVGGGAFEALVPLGQDVVSGDPVILPALSSKVFGTVEAITELKEEGFKKIFFSLPVNPNLLRTVVITLN